MKFRIIKYVSCIESWSCTHMTLPLCIIFTSVLDNKDSTQHWTFIFSFANLRLHRKIASSSEISRSIRHISKTFSCRERKNFLLFRYLLESWKCWIRFGLNPARIRIPTISLHDRVAAWIKGSLSWGWIKSRQCTMIFSMRVLSPRRTAKTNG